MLFKLALQIGLDLLHGLQFLVQHHFAYQDIDAWPKKRDPALEEAITLLSSKTPN